MVAAGVTINLTATMKNGDFDLFGLKYFLIISMVVIPSSAFTAKCPSPSQWNIRANSQCPITDGYMCLFDENENYYREICRRRTYFDPAGYKFVIVGNPDRRKCDSSRYQPFKFSTYGMSVCIFEKTYCSEEGQIIFNNGSTNTDRKCRCDYTRDYDYTTKPTHSCFCVPSMEDCSCYQKSCPQGFVLSPDYQCINLTSWSSQFTCDLILPYKPKDTNHPSNDNNLDGGKAAPERNVRIVLGIVIGVTLIVTLIMVQITWFCLPKIESFKVKKNVLRENIELRSILAGKVIPQNIKDLQQHAKKQWNERFCHFVETRSFQALTERIKEEQCFIISGPFGCGKTSLAFHIALKLEDNLGFDFMIISNPEDILRYASADKKQIFLIDDVFGKFSISKDDTFWWKHQGESIQHLMTRNKNLRILMTSRLHIYNSVNNELKVKFCPFNLTSKDLALTVEDRKNIGRCYLPDDIINRTLCKEVILLYSFFPALCANFFDCKNENIIQYFTCPVEYIKTDIENISKPPDLSYLALAVLIICGNNVNKDIFNQNNHKYDGMLKCVSKEISYGRKPSKQLLLSRLMDLTDSYVLENVSSFECLHVNLFNALAFCIGPCIMRSIILYGTTSFLIDKLQMKISNEYFPKLAIMIPNSLQESYFERMLLDMKTALQNIFVGSQHLSAKFRESYIVYMKKHLKKGDLKKDINSTTVLHFVSAEGYEDYVEFFLGLDKTIVNLQDYLGQTALHKACIKGHINVMKLLLAKGGTIDKSDNDGKTPLDIACAEELIDTVEFLLFKKAPIRSKRRDLQSALHVACRKNQLEIAELLLKYKANVNATDTRGDTPLNLTCKEGHIRIVKLLMNYQPDIDISSNCGRTALYNAALRNDINIVRCLLKSNANPNKFTKKGNVPLHCASDYGSLEIAELLIDHKASVEIDDIEGCTPLYFACKNGHLAVAKLLLKNNANINKINGVLVTPLFIACQNNHIDIVKLLLEHKANVYCKNLDLLTPLHVACMNNHKDIISHLIQHGASVNGQYTNEQTSLFRAQFKFYKIFLAFMSKSDKTPLHITCEKGDEETVKLLLHAGANVNEANSDGITPLHIACEEENEKEVNGVSDGNNYVNEGDDNGITAFHMTFKAGKIEIVQLLLENGAKFDAADLNRKTPLHVACKSGKEEIVSLLLDAGADLNTIDKDGKTPLQTACTAGNTSIVNLLLAKAKQS